MNDEADVFGNHYTDDPVCNSYIFTLFLILFSIYKHLIEEAFSNNKVYKSLHTAFLDPKRKYQIP